MGRIGGLFGRSTMGPIAEHLLKCQECVDILEELIDRFVTGKSVGDLAERINRCESDADLIKNEIRRNMTPSVWSAVERAEVVRLLGKEDDIADGAAAIAQLLKVRKTACPEESGKNPSAMGRRRSRSRGPIGRRSQRCSRGDRKSHGKEPYRAVP